MELVISNASNLPIYEQIVVGVKQHILSGELHEGDLLPSIRALAKDLRISVITTKRAYEDLERMGLVEMQPGKGCFVAAGNRELMREAALKRVEDHLQAAINAAAGSGISADDVRQMLELLLEGV